MPRGTLIIGLLILMPLTALAGTGGTIEMMNGESVTFHDIKAFAVQTASSHYLLRGAEKGLWVHRDGRDQLVPFADLVSFEISSATPGQCSTGVIEDLCHPYVRLETKAGSFHVNYESIRSVRVEVSNEMTGRSQEQKFYFRNRQGQQILKIRFR